jgi:hypothetical protein
MNSLYYLKIAAAWDNEEEIRHWLTTKESKVCIEDIPWTKTIFWRQYYAWNYIFFISKVKLINGPVITVEIMIDFMKSEIKYIFLSKNGVEKVAFGNGLEVTVCL